MKRFILLICIIFCFNSYSKDLIKPLEFEGYDFTSSKLIKLNQFKGKVVYIDFWASWCTPCLKSLPFLETLHQRYSSEYFTIIAINIDENKSDAESFLKKHPINYLNLYDPKGTIGKQLAVNKMPTAFLIDKEGNLILKHTGFNQKYAKKIEQLLEKMLNSS